MKVKRLGQILFVTVASSLVAYGLLKIDPISLSHAAGEKKCTVIETSEMKEFDDIFFKHVNLGWQVKAANIASVSVPNMGGGIHHNEIRYFAVLCNY